MALNPIDRQGINPAAVPVVSTHHRPYHLAVLGSDKEQIRVAGDLPLYRCYRVVMWRIVANDVRPQRDDAFPIGIAVPANLESPLP